MRNECDMFVYFFQGETGFSMVRGLIGLGDFNRKQVFGFKFIRFKIFFGFLTFFDWSVFP